MSRFATPTRSDVYADVTNAILAQLESGVRPWSCPWSVAGSSFSLPMRACGEAYRGINILLLWGAATEKGFTNPNWMTYKQAQELGGHVRAGEKASKIVYANTIIKEQDGENGETEEVKIPYMKSYAVFNAQQIDGLPARFYPVAVTDESTGPEAIGHAEEFFGRVGATVRHGGAMAFYSPSSDHVQMPALKAFRDAESYYSTLAHEVTHWTSHAGRCDRVLGKRFGDAAYAAEELVAELGAAFLCSILGLSSEPREDHAQYLASWLKVLKSDKRAIFTMASAAQKACDFIQSAAQADPMAKAA